MKRFLQKLFELPTSSLKKRGGGILGIWVFLALLCTFVPPASSSPDNPQRIVSLSPSVTEIVYALHLQDFLVGVTRFCLYPPEAQKKEQIGGLLDTNYEMIYRLHPDLVLAESNQSDQRDKLQKMGFPVMGTETKSIRGISNSIAAIGKKFGQEKAARDIIADIDQKIAGIEAKTKNLSRPRVLVTYERIPGEKQIRQVYVAGNDTFFADLIRLAGGQNAYQGSQLITSPVLTAEGILHMNPDVIIEVMPTTYIKNFSLQTALQDWASLPDLQAYQKQRIYILTQDYLTIPGPRVGQALMDLARCIHPEVFKE